MQLIVKGKPARTWCADHNQLYGSRACVLCVKARKREQARIKRILEGVREYRRSLAV
jgi:hypothetical protein